jgi:beta-fructofuranosidase
MRNAHLCTPEAATKINMKNKIRFAHLQHPTTRRSFIAAISTAAASTFIAPRMAGLSFVSSRSATAALAASLAADALRPQYHLLPAANWMNDPNGPIYWHGQYHMFFQYNPNAAIWGDMHWAHAVSPDMIHWKHLPVALAPTPGGPDQDGCFTGSAVDDAGTATFLYTGIAPSTPERATLRDPAHPHRETQHLAISTDPGLRTWKKLPQPVLEPPDDPMIAGFRDPFLWKEGATWYLGVGSGVLKQGGRVLLYRSADLRRWASAGVLASGKWNGKDTPDSVDSGEMWECPDFFALGKKHVLIYSTERKVYWQSGELDLKEMKFHAQKSGLLDSGAYYAPKTQTAADGSRILWGWITETRPEAEFSKAGWAGCMSLPRVLSLDAEDSLLMRPASQATALRGQEFSLPGFAVAPAARRNVLQQFRLTNLAGEMSLRILPQPFAMNLTDGHTNFLSLSYDPSKEGSELLVNGAAASLPSGGSKEIALTLFVDGSVIELFANDRACRTIRSYQMPTQALSLQIAEDALSRVLSLHAWQITPISPDRLTT